jgi:hypothetical protein
MRRIATLTISAATVALALAACTPAGSPTPKPAGAASSTATAPGLPEGVSQATGVPTAVPNEPAQRKNVTMTDCARTADGWKASGTAVNLDASTATYTVTIFFTAPTATVLAIGDTDFEVEPGARSDWTVTSAFTAPDGTLCVLSGVATR